jgi:hypothetical protein
LPGDLLWAASSIGGRVSASLLHGSTKLNHTRRFSSFPAAAMSFQEYSSLPPLIMMTKIFISDDDDDDIDDDDDDDDEFKDDDDYFGGFSILSLLCPFSRPGQSVCMR